MSRTLLKLARWWSNLNRLAVVAVFVLVCLAGHCLLAWLLPQGGMAAEFGFFVFVFLVAAAAEQAESLRSIRFIAWLLASLALAILAGVALSSA